MITVFISMFVFALIGAITPGPVNIIATGSGANFGFRRTLPYVFGATVSYTVILILMGIGLNTTLKVFPEITSIIQTIGAVFLLYMSYKIATAKPFDIKGAVTAKPPGFIEGALTQGLNPKAWLVSMSGVSLFVLANSPASLYLLMLCSISFVITIASISTWAAIGQLIGRFLSTRKRQVTFNILMGLLLSATVASIFINK